MEETLARSHSCRSSSQLGARKVSSARKQSDSFVDKVQLSAPINQAESYQQPKSVSDQEHFVKRFVENLLLEPCNHQSRQSAASLKVHFQSVDDVADQPIDDQYSTVNVDLNDNSSDSRPRCHSEAASWSVSESDITGQGVDDGEDDDGNLEFANVAPDGGWGWVVVAASFVINLIADGATFSFGVVYVELLDYFKESRGYTAWIGGLFMAVPLISGPLASSLTDRYGCRNVTIVGSILAALGFILSSISNSLEVLFLTFGLISGFGLSLCYVAAIVIVAYYFEKRRSLATGLAVCGSGIGTFIFAPLTQYLIEEYGWRGTTLIVAGLFLNMCVCGALMRDIEGFQGPSTRRKRNTVSRSTSNVAVGRRSRNTSESQFDSTQERIDDQTDVISTLNHLSQGADLEKDPQSEARLCNSLISLPTFIRRGEKIPQEVLITITNNKRLYSIILENYPALFENLNADTTKADAENPAETNETTTSLASHSGNSKDSASVPLVAALPLCSHTSNRCLHAQPAHLNAAHLRGLLVKKRSLTYRGAMLNLPRYRLRASSCPDIYRNSMTTIAREKEGAFTDYMEELREVLMDMFDISHLSNPRFVMFAISNVLLYSCYHVPYVYMADWAIAQGHPQEDASFLLSVVGILNTLGEVIMGYMGDRSWVNATWIYSGCMLLCGLSTAAVPLLPNYTWLAAASGLFGLSIAANYSLTAVILVDVISLERFVNAYGLLLMFQGAANLVGPPLAGWICDVTGSYDTSFYIAGGLIMLSGMILIMLPLLQHCRLRMSTVNNNSENKSTNSQQINPVDLH